METYPSPPVENVCTPPERVFKVLSPVEVAPSEHTPLMAKHPPAKLMPCPTPDDVAVHEIAPVTASIVPGEVVPPIPVLPKELIMKTVDVVKVVEVETANIGIVVEEENPAIESLANGVVVPIPTVPTKVDVPVVSTAIGTVVVGRSANTPYPLVKSCQLSPNPAPSAVVASVPQIMFPEVSVSSAC